jgi:abortive infection bacteriophage resistance protein
MSQNTPPLSPPKPFKTYAELVALLQRRGMTVEDPGRAERKLSQVGYYRLSGFWYPCRQIDFDAATGKANCCPQTGFPIRKDDMLPGTSFNAVFNLYLFDKRLRLAMMDGIERVEIHLRAIMAHELGYHNPLAYEDASFIHPKHLATFSKNGRARNSWPDWRERVQKQIETSREDCIVWHRKKGKALPIWVIIETWDFGIMSRYFDMLAGKHQQRICRRLGACAAKDLVGWLRELNTLRNRCAHHARIWNQKTGNPLSIKSVPRLLALGLNANALSRLYGQICILWHLVTLIGPSSQWLQVVADIVDSKPTLPNCGYVAMGLPDENGFPRHLF